MKKSLLEVRANVIKYIYKFELLEMKLDATDAFESGDFTPMEIKIIEVITKHYDKLKRLVVANLVDSWKWHRVAPLERAILLFGAYELAKHDKALVINELVIITEGYIPGDSYKFINKILDNIGNYYLSKKVA